MSARSKKRVATRLHPRFRRKQAECEAAGQSENAFIWQTLALAADMQKLSQQLDGHLNRGTSLDSDLARHLASKLIAIATILPERTLASLYIVNEFDSWLGSVSLDDLADEI